MITMISMRFPLKIYRIIFTMAIFPKLPIYAEAENKTLLILKDHNILDVRTFWNKTTTIFDPNERDNIAFRDALLLGNYRSPLIDIWDVYSPNMVIMGAYNIFGDILWEFNFNTAESMSSLSNWLTNSRYLYSYPDDISQSTVSCSIDNGISVSTDSSNQFITILNVSMTTYLSSIVIFTHAVPEFVPLYTGIGCFHYTSVAADKSTQVTDNLMDVEMCLEACSSQAASTHFMIEYMNYCSCGTMLYPDRLLDESQCLYFCPGDNINKCGGVMGVYSVYSKNTVQTSLFEKREDVIPSSSIIYLQSNLHQINNSAGTRLFIDGIVVSDSSGGTSMFSLYYSPDYCTLNSSLEGFHQYQDGSNLTVFPANGSLISLPLLPYRCIRLAMTSATWEVKSIAVTLYYPDKYTNAPYFVIEGVYGLILSTTESTTETTSPSSEAQSTTIVNEMSTAAVVSTVQVSTAKPSTASVPNNSQITCLCDCDIFPNLIDWDSLSPEEKERMMKFLIEDLRVNKENLSSTIRRKSSASDKRKSSAAIGCVGIVVLSIVLGLLVMPDVFYFLHYLLKTITQKFTKKT